MPKFRQIPHILSLMANKALIRNLGIIAHIDHGKTTLTDALLAGTGLLPLKAAGSARVLDYLEEEQKRGITMKTANISLLYKAADSGAFIINLVDTPGHVDFTGKVTRALRSIDGAIVVIDAVEEIMPQTEVVLRQALEERVRPVLFINKVDRLITELKLTENQIRERFARIIRGFNDLIDIYGESEFKEKWKADPASGSVAFGSALHKWGFTLGMARQQNVTFSAIMAAHNRAAHETLADVLPLHKAILGMAVRHLPSPLEAQKYRIPKIWKGDVGSAVGQAMAECDDNGPAVACITHVQEDPSAGLIATCRVFSGTVKSGSRVYLVNAQAEGVIQQVYIYMGAFRELVAQVSAGNIAAFSGLQLAKAGETIVAAEHREGIVPFERIRYVAEPVVTVAVEPKNPRDLPVLLEAMRKLAVEDPNLAFPVSNETGEYLLSGVGALHLEVALKLLKERGGIEIAASSPRVVYRETASKEGIIAAARSTNKQNRFAVQVSPLSEALVRQIEQDKASVECMQGVLAVDDNQNLLLNCTESPERLQEILDPIISGFAFACKAGPLCGEPMRGVQVKLLGVQLSENAAQHDPAEVMRGVGKAIFGSFLTATPMLLEPVYSTVITVPAELAGECSRIISSRRGKISCFEQKGASTVITGYIPVAETFSLSEELRGATSGRTFWQYIFSHWERLPEKLEARVIAEIRKRKGLPPNVPKPERFLEETL
ncbi:MAG: elongation factor EF-2 [Candidatus Bathyarchaeia archaeon]